MDPILKDLRAFKKEIEASKQDKEVIIDVSYYGQLNLSKNDYEISNIRKEELYLVKKELDGKTSLEFCTNYGTVATVGENEQIEIDEEYKEFINEKEFLMQLEKIMPLSLEKLEKLEQKRQKSVNSKTEKTGQAEKENDEEIKEENTSEKPLYKKNSKDVEIDLGKKITETKTFLDLVPEAKQKGIQKVVARRTSNSEFELIGVNGAGEEIKLETLEQTEGTNPVKDITEISGNGKVEQDKVMTILKIKNGENQGKQDEGFTIDLGNYGIPEVNYYRRAKETNEYSSIPVNLKNTNQKRTDKDVREYIEKRRNTSVEDNIIRAEDRIKYNSDNETELENIDDNLNNDNVIDESEILIRKAAARCKMEVKEFKKELEKADGNSLEEKIETTEEEINEQFRGTNKTRA